MFCPKCGNEVAEGSAFCGKCGAPVGGPAAAAETPGAAAAGLKPAPMGVPGVPSPKKGGAKVGIIAAAAVVVVVLVAGFATNWFGLAGVQPKEAVDVPVASQSANDAPDADGQDAAGDQGGEAATVKSAVEAYTWDELAQISDEIGAAGDEAAAIEVAKKYNLCTPEGKLDGTQVKLVTLTNNMTVPVQIVGFAHDDKTAGGKAGITFMFGDAIAEAPMNQTDTNAGGWEASQMRAYLNGDGMALLPEDLKKVVAPVDKLTNNVGETQDVSAVTTTSDSLWLLSAAELCGSIDWYSDPSYNAVLNAEGFEYQLFRDTAVDSSNANDILVKNYQNSPYFWWGRSPDPGYSDGFRIVYSGGDPGYDGDASYSRGVVPGFCL
ncbi:zinc ribbon domain-containing protein [Adlercreutzia muris]|uniref:zinc ribbon domain-containing protein n=1 Tax=Adlercreutzia muris TaxID=1796610 RepID=UPI0021D5B200|nr:zinc ribbon domain-containing protein [Adlercreutzia muris]MCU7585169.1 zinc ribbon domain-containing protein [Adlercreutzia muris]